MWLSLEISPGPIKFIEFLPLMPENLVQNENTESYKFKSKNQRKRNLEKEKEISLVFKI